MKVEGIHSNEMGFMANGISNFLNIQNSGKLIKGTASYQNKFEILINSGKFNHFNKLILIFIKENKNFT